MKKNTQIRKLAKTLKPFGLTIVQGDHNKVLNGNGQAVYWFSGTPSCDYWADNVIRDLANMGLVEERLKRLRIR